MAFDVVGADVEELLADGVRPFLGGHDGRSGWYTEEFEVVPHHCPTFSQPASVAPSFWAAIGSDLLKTGLSILIERIAWALVDSSSGFERELLVEDDLFSVENQPSLAADLAPVPQVQISLDDIRAARSGLARVEELMSRRGDGDVTIRTHPVVRRCLLDLAALGDALNGTSENPEHRAMLKSSSNAAAVEDRTLLFDDVLQTRTPVDDFAKLQASSDQAREVDHIARSF